MTYEGLNQYLQAAEQNVKNIPEWEWNQGFAAGLRAAETLIIKNLDMGAAA